MGRPISPPTVTYPRSLLVILSKPSYQVVETDQRTTQIQKRLVDVVPPLIAD
jgi:hypothetical protein